MIQNYLLVCKSAIGKIMKIPFEIAGDFTKADGIFYIFCFSFLEKSSCRV
jgi:hypothetical protein